MQLNTLPYSFTICKVLDYSQVDLNAPFCFIQKTPTENALICLSDSVPKNVTASEAGWKACTISGTLDFSLIGILAQITSILADRHIPVCAISTFDTDYFLIKSELFELALLALKEAGYTIA